MIRASSIRSLLTFFVRGMGAPRRCSEFSLVLLPFFDPKRVSESSSDQHEGKNRGSVSYSVLRPFYIGSRASQVRRLRLSTGTVRNTDQKHTQNREQNKKECSPPSTRKTLTLFSLAGILSRSRDDLLPSIEFYALWQSPFPRT